MASSSVPWVRFVAVVVTVAGWLLCAGCGGGTPRVSLKPPGKTPRASDYPAALDRWTRSDNILSFEHLDTTLRVHVTCFSPEFTAAYVSKYTELFKISGRERANMAQEFQKSWAESYTFLVAAATTKNAWNDFDEDESVWKVALVNDLEQQVAPSSVELKREITATTHEFFPYVRNFYRVYMFRFPRKLEDGKPLVTASSRHLALRFAGPLGQTRLVWRLR